MLIILADKFTRYKKNLILALVIYFVHDTIVSSTQMMIYDFRYKLVLKCNGFAKKTFSHIVRKVHALYKSECTIHFNMSV